MGSRNFSDLVSRAKWLVWIALGFVTLNSLNMTFFNFLFHLQPLRPGVPNLILASTELVRLVLSSWLFFTVFFRPQARSIIPSREIWQNSAETLKMITQWEFYTLWRVIVGEAGLRISTQGAKGILSTQTFGILAVIVMGWTLLRLWRWQGVKLIEQQKLEAIPDLSIEAHALQKIRHNLARHEQRELKQLMYETEATKQAAIQTVARIILASLIFALIMEIGEEIIQRF